MNTVADVLIVLRHAVGLTQEEAAERLHIAQATLSRYENSLREPDPEALGRLADLYGVTAGLILHEFRVSGGIAADVHMRRQKTAKPTDWKRVEARLNLTRMHSSFLLERVPLRSGNYLMQVDPVDVEPVDAAMLVRTSWKMPIGPVRHLIRWIESAGVLVVEDDFSTRRVEAMSQWAGDHAVIIINNGLSTDRKRLTLAHEIAHLVLHSGYVDNLSDMEQQANEFAAEFLMPSQVIGPELRGLDPGKLTALKLKWGVSMQAIIEHAYRLGRITGATRQQLYKQISARRWSTNEPYSDQLTPETPELAQSIGERLSSTGLSDSEIRQMVGVAAQSPTIFIAPKTGLHLVA